VRRRRERSFLALLREFRGSGSRPEVPRISVIISSYLSTSATASQAATAAPMGPRPSDRCSLGYSVKREWCRPMTAVAIVGWVSTSAKITTTPKREAGTAARRRAPSGAIRVRSRPFLLNVWHH
jgi:hypothetical protein